MEDIEAIERATLDAVPPQRLVAWGDWLLALDSGTVRRCHSAVPLRHAAPSPGVLPELERRYAQAGLPLLLRLPDVPAFHAFRTQLEQEGYAPSGPVLVQTGSLQELATAKACAAEIEWSESPGPDWEQVFLGEGFDPVDGASRLDILRRGRQALFASARVDGKTVAVGSASLSQGWCGIHGMRTLPAWRGRGFASAILCALAAAARGRGLQHVFLQVEEANATARALYAARGFRPAWGYAYWRRPQG